MIGLAAADKHQLGRFRMQAHARQAGDNRDGGFGMSQALFPGIGQQQARGIGAVRTRLFLRIHAVPNDGFGHARPVIIAHYRSSRILDGQPPSGHLRAVTLNKVQGKHRGVGQAIVVRGESRRIGR